MPVIEYKLIKTSQGNEVPSFVKNGGHWRNPSDFSMVGWVDPKPRKYYVPDTIVELDQLEFSERLLKMHAVNPFEEDPASNEDNEDVDLSSDIIYKDSDGVIAMADAWYTEFVEANS